MSRRPADASLSVFRNPRSVASFLDDAALTPLGFGQFVDFNGGTLRTTGSLVTSRTISLLALGGTIDTNGFDSTVSGNIINSGSLTKTGAGTLTLTGINTYSGGTNLNGGVLAVNSDANLGTGALTFSGGTLEALAAGGGVNSSKAVALNAGSGTFLADAGTKSTLSGVISGVGSLTKTGSGTLVLANANTYSGGTNLNGGILAVNNDGNLGTGALSFNGGTLEALATGGGVNSSKAITLNAGGGTFLADPGTSSTLSGAITGNGSLTKNGLGTLTLSGNNTYSGTTNVSSGILKAGSPTALSANSAFTVTSVLDLNGFNNTIGSLAGGGTVTNNGGSPATLTTGGDNTNTTFSGTLIDGSSNLALTKSGVGTMTLTGANTYTGGTTITAGTLQLGNGGTTGSILGDVVDNGTLVFDHGGGNTTFAGLISGSGNLVKIGSDTLVLAANNSYSGGTFLQDGALVAGTPSAAQLVSFALGTGDVFVLGGTLRTPSLDPLTINVGGNYTQGPGGTLAIGVAGINGKDYDHVQVQGDASLNGTLAVSSLNNFRPVAGNAFEVLHANGTRSGHFAQVNDFLNNNRNLQRIDVYAPNGVALVYLSAPPPPPPAAKPPIIVEAPTPLPPVNPDARLLLPFLLEELDPTAEQLTSLYEISFSGANTQRFNLQDRLIEIRRGSTGFVSKLPTAPTTYEGKQSVVDDKAVAEKPSILQPGPQNRWGVWANGWGDFVSLDDTNSAKGYNFTTGGFILGIDYRITDHFAVGLMGSYAYTDSHLQPAGDIDVNTGRGGLYATYFDRGFYVNVAAYGGHNTYNTSRQGLLGFADGSTSGGEFSTFIEAGYNFHFGKITVGPTAASQYTYVSVNGFNERGSLLPLQIHSNSRDSFRTDLGAQASYTWDCRGVLLIPSVTAFWEHEYLYSALPITVSSGQLRGATPTFFGPNEGHDSAIVNAGLGIQWTPGISTYVGYQGQLGGNHYNSNAVTGNISFSF